jgi:hypothetical protein
MITSRRMECVRHAACMGEMRDALKFWWESLKGRDHLEDLDIDRRIILKCILGKYGVRMWTRFIWLT